LSQKTCLLSLFFIDRLPRPGCELLENSAVKFGVFMYFQKSSDNNLIFLGVLSAFADPNDAEEAVPYESIPNAQHLNLNWEEQSFRPVPFSAEFNKNQSTPNQPKNTY
jgi:hypothetical protein